MATQNTGLATDPSKINPYGASQEQLSEYQKTLEDQIKALESRYAQPNWFKVAAGFAKPQLGGFFASLGSAAEALGENVEQQRASALPIAQMRAQLAQSNILTGQNKTQSERFAEWQATGKPMDQRTYAEINALNPGSAIAAAAKSAYEGGSKDIENTRAQQRMILDAIQMKQAKGMPLSASEKNFLQNFGSGALNAPETARASNMAEPKDQGLNAPVGRFDLSAPNAVANIKKSIEGIADPAERERAMQAFNSQINPNQADAREAPKKETFYPPTFPSPDTSGMTDPEREYRMNAVKQNAERAEAKSAAQVEQWKSVAADPVYSSINSEYESAINLLKSQPEVARKVFNLLRKDGSLVNQLASAAQTGMGVNLGSMAANVSVPTEAFMRAGLSEPQQLLADRLVRAMLIVGNAKLTSQGITPEKGQETYKQYLDNTKASLQQNAATALHNLQKDYVTFRQNKRLYDQIEIEHSNQSQYSPTPYTDVLKKSSVLKKISEDAREEMKKHEAEYEAAIRARAKN